MRKLLTAEIHYNQAYFLSAIAGFALIAVLRLSDAVGLDTAFSFSWMVFFFAIGFSSALLTKNKRARFWAGLPVAAKQAGATHTYFHIAFFVIVVIFWLTILPFESKAAIKDDLWPYLSANSLVFNMYLFAFIVQNLAFRRNKSRMKRAIFEVVLFGAVVVALFAVLVSNKNNPSPAVFAVWIRDYPILPIVCIAPFPFLVALSIKTYASRESFLS